MKNQGFRSISLIFTGLISIGLLSFGCHKIEDENSAPDCKITSPNKGDELVLGERVIISAEAEDTDGSVIEVQFYIDGSEVSSVSNAPFIYQWNTADEEIGSHTIRATAKDDGGSTVSDEIVVSLLYLLEADFTADKTILSIGNSVQFTDQSTSTTISWSWDFGDGETSSSQNPSHTFSTAGNYTVSLIVTDNYGTDTETKIDFIICVGGDIGLVSDFDENQYTTIKIGNQWWMAENLKSTHYADGTEIPLVELALSWEFMDSTYKAYCYYNNSESIGDTYGALYTWTAAMNGAASSNANPGIIQGVCPDGWHLPGDAEWRNLIDSLGNTDRAGGHMKEAGTIHWIGPNTDATNSSGFSALPGGLRVSHGSFDSKGSLATFWTSTSTVSSDIEQLGTAWYLSLFNDSPEAPRNYTNMKNGLSVRCLKDY